MSGESATNTQITVIRDAADLEIFEAAIADKALLACDAEGVNLSRVGAATLLAIGVQNEDNVHVYLFDLLHLVGSDFYHSEIQILKAILENRTIIKIVHDCRQDSDALYKFLNITLSGVFDTSIYDMEIRNMEAETKVNRSNLNKTLQTYNCQENEVRNKPADFYDLNPQYWALRSLDALGENVLSEEQIAWASGDISSLFELRSAILRKTPSDQLDSIQILSEQAACEFRDSRFDAIVVVTDRDAMGRVIGKYGNTICQIILSTGATSIERTRLGGFLVLAKTNEILKNAKALIEQKANEKSKTKSYKKY